MSGVRGGMGILPISINLMNEHSVEPLQLAGAMPTVFPKGLCDLRAAPQQMPQRQSQL